MEQDVSKRKHAPGLDLPLSKDDFIEVSLGKQLSMLLDVVLLLGQLSWLGFSSVGNFPLPRGVWLGVGCVGDASCGGRRLGSLRAALPLARLYTVGGRR